MNELASAGYNDIIAASWLGDAVHFNGYSWRRVLTSMGREVAIEGCDYRGDVVVLVGSYYVPEWGNSVGLIIRGRHLN